MGFGPGQQSGSKPGVQKLMSISLTQVYSYLELAEGYTLTRAKCMNKENAFLNEFEPDVTESLH